MDLTMYGRVIAADDIRDAWSAAWIPFASDHRHGAFGHAKLVIKLYTSLMFSAVHVHVDAGTEVSEEDLRPTQAYAAAEAILRIKKQRPLYCNAQMGPKEIRAYCKPSDEVKNLLRAAIQQLGLSARAYDRLLKVSRTIADP